MFPNQGGNLQFSKEVEDEANSYFQRIYNNTPNSTPPPMSVEQTLELLKNFKDSQVEREKVGYFDMNPFPVLFKGLVVLLNFTLI